LSVLETVLSIGRFSAEDLPEALEIERVSQPEPWTAGQFLEELQNPLSRFWVVRERTAKQRAPHSMGSLSGRDMERGVDRGLISLRGGRFVLETPQGTPRWSVLAGYICTWFVADEVQILNIAVSPMFRRQGFGRLLLGHALAEGIKNGARLAVLEVRRSNTAAQRLYETFGFAAVGERPGYYTVQPESAVIMHLSLAPSL